jgi:hypothetical protein
MIMGMETSSYHDKDLLSRANGDIERLEMQIHAMKLDLTNRDKEV